MQQGDERAAHVLDIHDRMHADRSNFNTLWQRVSERVLPDYSNFVQTHVEGQRRTDRVFDSTAPLALGHFCAALESMLCPASTRWHRIRPKDPGMWGDIAIMQYCDQITDILFAARYAPTANFQSQVNSSFKQIGAFGNGPMLIDDVVGYGLRYRALPLPQTYGMENAAGVIDHVQYEYTLTARAAVDAVKRGMFDADRFPAEITQAATVTPNKTYEFIHAVYPNEERNPRAKDHTRMDFTSCQVSKDYKCTLRESGYSTQPMLFARYSVAPKETYGRGPCVDVYPEIASLNEMAKSELRQSQRAMEPPLLLGDDESLGAFDLRGNALNYGYMDQNGKPRATYLEYAGNFQLADNTIDRRRKIIESALLVDIFSIMVQQPQMTATEVLQRAQEKGQLLAPIIGRIQSELFGPMITREMDILERAGQFPPPPRKLAQMGHFEWDVVYESQIQVAQRQSKALAINLVLQQAQPLFQIDPNTAKRLNADRMLQLLGDANGAPAAMFNTDDEQQQKDAAAAQQAQLANMAQMAPAASATIKNLAQAQQASGSTLPGNLLGNQQ